MKIKIKKLKENIEIPSYESEQASAFDIICLDGKITDVNKKLIMFKTGFAVEIPKGYELKIYQRSSTYPRYGLRLQNLVGIIDSDYRGEVLVGMVYEGPLAPDIRNVLNGKKLVQGKLERLGPKAEFVEVDSLSETKRGSGGHGSTGE